jgi:uncharacterized protein with GYD domain
MATYILLITLTPEGQVMALRDPDYLLQAEHEINTPGVMTLGVYGVLGEYDFVTLIEADSNETVARFSIELGVKAGVHITTLPVVPAARMKDEEQTPARGAAVKDLPEMSQN